MPDKANMSSSRIPKPNPDDEEDEFIHSDEEDIELIDDLEGQRQDEDDEDNENDDTGRMDSEPLTLFEPEHDDAEFYFKEHVDSVFVIDISSSGELFVSGGKDDCAWVWDSKGNPLFKITGFDDSVVNIGFNSTAKFVLAADMSGKIQVYDTEQKTCVFDTQVDEINWTRWHKSANVLVAGTRDGTIWMWMIPTGQSRMYQSYGEASVCGRFLHDGQKIVSGYADGTLRVWDLKTCDCTATSAKLHNGEVLCIDVSSDNIVASGSNSGLKLSSAVTGKHLVDVPGFEDCVESVAFSPSNPWLAAGGLDGTLVVWDHQRSQLRHKLVVSEAGICKLLWGGPNHLIIANLDGATRQVDVRDGSIVQCWTGHRSNLLDIAIGKEVFATASDDQTVGVFKFTLS